MSLCLLMKYLYQSYYGLLFWMVYFFLPLKQLPESNLETLQASNSFPFSPFHWGFRQTASPHCLWILYQCRAVPQPLLNLTLSFARNYRTNQTYLLLFLRINDSPSCHRGLALPWSPFLLLCLANTSFVSSLLLSLLGWMLMP